MKVEYKFEIGTIVLITIFNLNFEGRITCAVWDGLVIKYTVQYAHDGSLCEADFHERDLEIKH